MSVLKKIIDFSVETSLWVALSVLSFLNISNSIFLIKDNIFLKGFVFCSVVLGYNFIRYYSNSIFKKAPNFTLVFKMLKNLNNKCKSLFFLNIICFAISFYCFMMLKTQTKIFLILPFLSTLFYTVSPGEKTLRNIEGLKIYVVGFTWAIVTVALPVIEFCLPLTEEVYVVFVQRFLITIILILPFEIRDLKEDNKQLKTVPQKIGVLNTKYYGLFLILIFSVLDFYRLSSISLITVVIAVLLAILLLFSNEKQSKYYASFVVEGLPIFWYTILFFV